MLFSYNNKKLFSCYHMIYVQSTLWLYVFSLCLADAIYLHFQILAPTDSAWLSLHTMDFDSDNRAFLYPISILFLICSGYSLLKKVFSSFSSFVSDHMSLQPLLLVFCH